jgi:predicted  nucleic acid-binding Zn-ribbon protein
LDTLKELQSQLAVKTIGAIESPERHESRLEERIRNINNNMNSSMEELKISVDIEVGDLNDRLYGIDKKLEDLEKYLDNINCEQVDINKRLKNVEKSLAKTRMKEYEAELDNEYNTKLNKHINIDNLNTKSNSEGSK